MIKNATWYSKIFVYHSERSCWHKMYRLFLLDQIPWIQINIGHNVDRKAQVFPWKPEKKKKRMAMNP